MSHQKFILVLENPVDRAADRNIFLCGTVKNVIMAFQLLQKRIEEKHDIDPSATETTRIVIPNDLCSRLIGKQGVTIKRIQSESGARTVVQTQEEMFQTEHYYGRAIIIYGAFRSRVIALYLILRQVIVMLL